MAQRGVGRTCGVGVGVTLAVVAGVGVGLGVRVGLDCAQYLATTVPIILPESLRYAQSVLDHPVE